MQFFKRCNIFYLWFRPNGDGLLLGISTSHPDASNGQNIYQAALETIAFQNRDILEAMQTESEMKLTTILADGGMHNYFNSDNH